MLPKSFPLPGSHFQYVDLRELFEMNGIPGRFRDWVRRTVIPLLGSAAVQYDRRDSHGNCRDYCTALPNAIALLAAEEVVEVRDTKAKLIPGLEIEYTHSTVILIPFHGLSTNKMYVPDLTGGPKKTLKKSPEYNAWINKAKPHVGKKPRWFKHPVLVHYEFSMASGSDTDNLIKSFQDLIFQHAWGGSDASVTTILAHGKHSRKGYWCKATIYQ